MAHVITYTVTITTTTCAACGTTFGIEEDLHNNLRTNGKAFYCPNGHPLAYGESQAKKLERQLAQERQKRDQAEAEAREAKRLRDETIELSNKLAQTSKQQAARLKRRIQNGVCPCCHRTVKQLAAHMASKHPEYAK